MWRRVIRKEISEGRKYGRGSGARGQWKDIGQWLVGKVGSSLRWWRFSTGVDKVGQWYSDMCRYAICEKSDVKNVVKHFA